MAALACSMFASVPILGQGTWVNGVVPVPGASPPRSRIGGVETHTFEYFRFEPLRNGVVASLSPALDQPAVVVFLSGPPPFVPSRTDVWGLRRDATVASLRTRGSETRKTSHSAYEINSFVFDGSASDVVGITVNIDGQLSARSLTPKPMK
jgi:hypothetical protein